MIRRAVSSAINPNSLEARLIDFSFHHTPPGTTESRAMSKQIPRGFDIYRVKAIVGRLFGIKPLHIKLIWETGEWDPVAGYEGNIEEDEDSEGDESPEADQAETEPGSAQRDEGRWTKRETELRDGTREVGFWVEGTEARIRVELR